MVVIFFFCACMVYSTPILSLQLESMNVSEANSGYGVGTFTLFFAFGAVVFGQLAQRFPRRYIILSGGFIQMVAIYLMGPCP